MEMDKDIEKILNALWKKKPEVTPEYARIASTLMLVQELRNLQRTQFFMSKRRSRRQ